MLRQAAEAGLGLAILPTFIASIGLQTGALEVVLADHPFERGGLYAVMPPGGAGTARVRALVDFLAARFGPEPSWDPCWLARGGEPDNRATIPAPSGRAGATAPQGSSASRPEHAAP
jgi:hypothetical protein